MFNRNSAIQCKYWLFSFLCFRSYAINVQGHEEKWYLLVVIIATATTAAAISIIIVSISVAASSLSTCRLYNNSGIYKMPVSYKIARISLIISNHALTFLQAVLFHSIHKRHRRHLGSPRIPIYRILYYLFAHKRH